jgi:capsid protein
MAMVKQVGSAIEIPYEQLLLHFDSSYSAARGAILEAWKFYRHRRHFLSRTMCQPVFEAWMEEAISLGRISAPGFFTDATVRAAYCASYWGGPGQGQINPLQETQAAQNRISWYLSTWEDEYTAIHGSEWNPSLERSARERKDIDSLGLPMPTISGSTQPAEPLQKTGTKPAQEPEEPADEPDDMPEGDE